MKEEPIKVQKTIKEGKVWKKRKRSTKKKSKTRG